jgi:hypothetical protein
MLVGLLYITSGCPHLVQKRLLAGLRSPQILQRFIGVPQRVQKRI